MKLPLVSIIMPVYNGEKYVEKSIASILNQTYSKLELIIVDDCSTDSSVELIEKIQDDRIRFYKNEKNLGYVKSCNWLFTKVEGDYVGFQDVDDFSSINKIELQIERLSEGFDVVGTNFVAYTEDFTAMFCSNFKLNHEDVLGEIPDLFNVKPSSFLFRRVILEDIGGYREFWDRIGCEDYDWFDRIIRKYRFSNLKDPLYHYLYSDDSITRTFDNPKKFFVAKILSFVVSYRNKNGFDPIDSGETKELDEFISKMLEPYRLDRSLLFSKAARRYFYNGEKDKGVKMAKMALIKKPSISNLRNYIYLWRNRK